MRKIPSSFIDDYLLNHFRERITRFNFQRTPRIVRDSRPRAVTPIGDTRLSARYRDPNFKSELYYTRLSFFSK
jgi:hypothetical protein